MQKLQKVNGRHINPQTYTDVFKYLTGGNIAWDTNGIKHAKESLKKFDTMLRTLNLIDGKEARLLSNNWYEHPYITERMFCTLMGVTDNLEYRTRAH